MLLKLSPLLVLLGCHGAPAPCQSFRAGDLSRPVELLPFAGGSPIRDGDPLTLTIPSQGGRVLLVAARVRNVEACGLTVSGELVDPATGKAVTELDLRQGDFTRLIDGFYESPVGDGEPNIPACPNHLGATIAGREATLRLTATDTGGRTGTVERRVTPVCPEGDASCPELCGPR